MKGMKNMAERREKYPVFTVNPFIFHDAENTVYLCNGKR